MIRALGPVAALLLSVAFLLMGNGLQNTLTPVRGDLDGFSNIGLGLLGGGYFAGFGLGCLLGPHLVRRAGHIRTFAAMVAVASSATLLQAVFVDVTAWIAFRLVTGLCFAVLFMIIESWLNERATNETRGFIFSAYIVINLTVVTLGQLMLVLDDPLDFSLFALASILVSVAAVPLAMTRSEQPAPPQATRLRLGHLYKLSPVGIVGAFAVGMANGPFWSLGPVFAQGTAVSEGAAAAGIFMAVGAISAAVGQWPLGRASDRMDRRRVILFACAGASAAGVATALFGSGGSVHLRLICVAAFGAFAIPLYALVVAHMNDMIVGDGFVEAAGGMLLTYAFGAIIGPIAASAAMSAFGVSSLFFWTAVVHGGLFLFVLFRIRHRVAPADAERGQFSEAVFQAQTVSTLDIVTSDDTPPEEPKPSATDDAAPTKSDDPENPKP